MEDFRTRLIALLTEGQSIVQSVQSTSFMISLAKAVAPYYLESEDLETLDKLIETLDLSNPVHQTYARYINWNKNCEAFFANSGLGKSLQSGEFTKLRKEAVGQILKKSPNQKIMLFRIREQLAILDSLTKLNVDQLRKETTPKQIPKTRSQRGKRRVQRIKRIEILIPSLIGIVIFIISLVGAGWSQRPIIDYHIAEEFLPASLGENDYPMNVTLRFRNRGNIDANLKLVVTVKNANVTTNGLQPWIEYSETQVKFNIWAMKNTETFNSYEAKVYPVGEP